MKTNQEHLDSYSDYMSGYELTDNPYGEDTDNQKAWELGWLTAKEEHPDLED